MQNNSILTNIKIKPFTLLKNDINIKPKFNISNDNKNKQKLFQIKKIIPKSNIKLQNSDLISNLNLNQLILSKNEKKQKFDNSIKNNEKSREICLNSQSNQNNLEKYIKEYKPPEVSGIPSWLFENFQKETFNKNNSSPLKTFSSDIKLSNMLLNKQIKSTKNIKKINFQSEEDKSLCIFCNKLLNNNYLKYEHLCPEKNLSQNPSRKNIQNICPICKGSYTRSYFLKHYKKCQKEGIWCKACEKKIPFEQMEKHNKKFHLNKLHKKRKGKIEWIRYRCEFCPKRIRIRNKYNHLLKCWGFRIFLTNPKIFDLKYFRQPNLYRRNWIKNKWVKIPFKVCKRVNIPKGYEIGCSYDLQGNKFVNFEEQQNIILPWIPEINKPKNRKMLIYDFLKRKTNRLPTRNAKEICEKIKLQVELEILKRKLEIKNFPNNLFNTHGEYKSENDNQFIDSLKAIRCYEISLKLKENIEKAQIDLLNFKTLPQCIQEKNISDKLDLQKDLFKMMELNKFLNESDDFQTKIREAENLELETCFASEDEIDCK